jgi:hypothetical protein
LIENKQLDVFVVPTVYGMMFADSLLAAIFGCLRRVLCSKACQAAALYDDTLL